MGGTRRWVLGCAFAALCGCGDVTHPLLWEVDPSGGDFGSLPGDGGPPAFEDGGVPDRGLEPSSLDRGLRVHFDFEEPEGPYGFVNRCERADTYPVEGASFDGGTALVSTATVGCSNANTRDFFDVFGPWTVAVWVRPDAASPSDVALSGLRFNDFFDIAVDGEGALRIRLRREPSIVLVPNAIGRWSHVVVRGDPVADRHDVWLDGVRFLSVGLAPTENGLGNGRTAQWVGALDDLRTYDRLLEAWEIEALADR